MYSFTKTLYATILLMLSFVLPAYAQPLLNMASPNIVINLPSRTLELYSGDTFIKDYPVAIGKLSTPTPLGSFSIINKEYNPAWIPPGRGYVVPSGPDNPLGYRWMGFLPSYGIHGTIAPWAIGLTVSNGCVRMHEADVEELFEVVKAGTPVTVTYDRVKVRIDDSGKASIGVYPDVYNYQPQVTLTEVNNNLVKYGLNGFASEQFLRAQIKNEPDKQVVFAQLFNIKVNDALLNQRGILIDDVFYLPIWAVTSARRSNIVWDERNQLVKTESKSVPGVVKGDIIYVTSENVQKLYGGQQVWDAGANCLQINDILLLVNGKLITNDVRKIDGVVAVPVLTLANSLGRKVVWDPANNIMTLQGKQVPIRLIDGQPYMQITQIYDFFTAYVYWNEQGRTVELTYPFKG